MRRAMIAAGKIKQRLGGNGDVLAGFLAAPERRVAGKLSARAATLSRGRGTR